MPNKSVKFSDDTTTIPDDILEPYSKPFTCPENDPFCQQLGICPSTLQRCARILQRFVRNNTQFWTTFNNEKSRLIEDMDDSFLVHQSQMERIADSLEEALREAKLEVALEFEDDDNNNGQALKQTVENQKQEIKALEAENAQYKTDCEEYKTKNKKIALDTFSVYESFSKAVHEIKKMQAEQHRLQLICQKYEGAVKVIEGMINTVNADTQTERTEREKLEDCMNRVIRIMEENHSKRKLLQKLEKIKSSAPSQVQANLRPIQV